MSTTNPAVYMRNNEELSYERRVRGRDGARPISSDDNRKIVVKNVVNIFRKSGKQKGQSCGMDEALPGIQRFSSPGWMQV